MDQPLTASAPASAGARWTRLDERLLRRWPLPSVPADADKEDRGRVLVVAGSREVPGAALLAGIAALRAGAGKLAVATAASVAPALALALPEARVIALPETAAGAFGPRAPALLEESARRAHAVLVGPGLMDAAGTCALVEDLLPLVRTTPLVLDALAMDVVRQRRGFDQPVLLTPHAGEMAHLRGLDKDAVLADPARAAAEAAHAWQATVALKGAATLIATPQGALWRHEAATPGLATSGSGDVLAGLIAGFAAAQPPLEQACAWGVVLHALAGGALARRLGPLGYLARELAAEVPPLVSRLRAPPAGSRGAPAAAPARRRA